MAIGEKKQILRGMYEKDVEGAPVDGAAGEAPAVGMMAASVERKGADRWMCRAAHAAIYFLIGVAGLVIWWTFHGHYMAGYAFAPSSRVERYIGDTFRLMGMSVFLILLGIGIFILFRESLPRRWRWVTFGLLVALFPLSLASGFFFPLAYRAGRAAGYGDLDLALVETDADTIMAIYNDGAAHVINSADADFAKVPAYTTDHLKAHSVEVSPSGVLIVNDAGRGHFEESEAGIFVPARRLSDAGDFAQRRHMQILGGTRPVMTFDENSDMGGLGTAHVPMKWK